MEEYEEVDPNLSLECEVCGSKDFHPESGFYYCSVCQTQSQESRLFVEEEQPHNLPGFHARLAVLRAKSATRKDRDLFERLTSWEVYNLVLKVFTDKLIEIGFPPILKDKVFQLYVSYLLKRKAILTRNKHSAVTQCEPNQNIYALYDRKPSKQPVRGPKRLAKIAKREAIDSGEHDDTVSASIAKRRKTKAKRKAFEQEYLEHVNQDTEAAPVDEYALDVDVKQPPSKKTKTAQSASRLTLTDGLLKVTKAMREHVSIDKLNRNSGLHASKNLPYINRQIGSLLAAERFSLRSALILLFVALRQIGCKVLVSDIIRMFHEGTLFVNSLRNFLPNEDIRRINLSCNDFIRCSMRQFNVAGFAIPIDVFLVYMGIEKFPIPKFKDFFPKFTEDLVLPNEFKYLVLRLNKSLNLQDLSKSFSRNGNQKYVPELSILPAIIVILKLLFGLDDATERYQSKFAKLVNQVLEDEQSNNEDTGLESEKDKLFVLEDWFSFIRYRETVTSLEIESSISCDPSHLPNVRNVQSSINKLRDQATRISGVSENNFRRLVAACDGAKSMFQQVSKDLKGGQEFPNLPQYNSPNLPKQDITKMYIDSYPNVSHDHFNVDKLKQNFYRRRIDFVYNPAKYIPILNKAGYKVKVIHGDALHYKKKLVFRGKKIILFQPYKSYSHAVGSNLNGTMSETMHFLLSLATSMIGGKGGSETKILWERVEAFGQHFRGISFK